jgi:hypothetical protein
VIERRLERDTSQDSRAQEQLTCESYRSEESGVDDNIAVAETLILILMLKLLCPFKSSSFTLETSSSFNVILFQI